MRFKRFNVNFRLLKTTHVRLLVCCLNFLTPNVNYSGRTALLTSKVAFYIFIQQI